MRVDGAGGHRVQGGITAQAMDPVSKNLRAQIMDAQKQMQELAANKDMEPEEKMERRKEIEQRITDLNAQLRQHEMELRQAKQQQVQQERQSEQARRQEAKQRAENVPGGKMDAGLPQGSMNAMLSADRSLLQAKVQGNVASSMKGRANVLRSEIEHSGRGAAVERKQESLAETEARMENLAKEQAQSLYKSRKEIEEAGKDAQEERKVQAKKQKEEKAGETGENGKVDQKSRKGLDAGEMDKMGRKENKEERREEKEEEDAHDGNLQMQIPVYRKVDLLL